MLAKKRKKRKIINNKKKRNFPSLLIIVFAFFAFYLTYTNIMIFLERARIGSDYKNLDETHKQLEEEKDSLKMQLGETYTDDYLKKVANEELGYYKEGESVIVIKKKEGENGIKEETAPENKNALGQLMDIFRGFFGQNKEDGK